MSYEIERKFLIWYDHRLIKSMNSILIQQAYLIIKNDVELRIRSYNKNFYFTLKSGSGLKRKEIEHEITESDFNDLLKYKIEKSKIIVKNRVKYDRWEIDYYTIPLLADKGIMEIELKDIDEELPSFPYFIKVIKDVTFDENYKNKNISLKGFPKI